MDTKQGKFTNNNYKFQDIATSDNFTIIVYNNQLFTFGKEFKCRLGLGSTNISHTDKPYILKLPSNNIFINGVACGASHCIMWDRDGKLYSWGDASDGKLGHGM